MNRMQTTKLCFLVRVAMFMILTRSVMSRPFTERNDSFIRNKISELYDSTEREAELQKDLDKLLYNSEHEDLRKMLNLVTEILDNEKGADIFRNLNTSEMPFYHHYIKSLVGGKVLKRLSRRRRGSFDSIGHRAGGLSGLGGSYTGRKVEYTLEQLLPFIIEELRRKNKFRF